MKSAPSRCLVDNWTLEFAGVLLEGGVEGLHRQRRREYRQAVDDSILGGVDETAEVVDSYSELDDYSNALTNLLSALLLFDDLVFARNGFEEAWQRLPGFSGTLKKVIEGCDQSEALRAHEAGSRARGAELGLPFYFALATALDADLLLSPQRSAAVRSKEHDDDESYSEVAEDLLATVDVQLAERVKRTGSSLLTARVISRVRFPSIASLVLSVAGKREEVLGAALDLRESKGVRDLRSVLRGCVAGVKAGARYAELVEAVSDAVRYATRGIGRLDPGQAWVSLGFQLLVIGISKTFGKPIPAHLLFLRDLAQCRLERRSCGDDLERLFGVAVSADGALS